MPCLIEDSAAGWRILSEFPSCVAGLSVSAMDEAGLKAILVDIRAAQQVLDALAVQVGARSNVLAAKGAAAPAAETLRGEGSVSASQARREAKRAGVASAQPLVSDAVARGAMSGEHIDVIARHTAKLTEEQQAQLDFANIVAQADRLPVETFNRHMKRAVDAIRSDQGLADTVAKQEASEFRHWFDHDAGMGRFSGSLDPERYEVLTNAIEQRCSTLAAAGGVEKNANLAVQALTDLVSGGGSRSNARSRLPSILVVVDHGTANGLDRPDSIRQTETGHEISAASLTRLACDATIQRVTLDQSGVPTNVGRKHRTATDAQWAALKAIYPTCAWDGCTAPINWCQAHHIHEWEHGGPTDLDNLVPLCSQHHHRVHEGQWAIKLRFDRTLSIYKPDGSHHTTTEKPTRYSALPRAA